LGGLADGDRDPARLVAGELVAGHGERALGGRRQPVFAVGGGLDVGLVVEAEVFRAGGGAFEEGDVGAAGVLDQRLLGLLALGDGDGLLLVLADRIVPLLRVARLLGGDVVGARRDLAEIGDAVLVGGLRAQRAGGDLGA